LEEEAAAAEAAEEEAAAAEAAAEAAVVAAEAGAAAAGAALPPPAEAASGTRMPRRQTPYRTPRRRAERQIDGSESYGYAPHKPQLHRKAHSLQT
jgi:hypothetical protein